MFGLTDTQILWIVILVLFLIVNYQINDIRSQLKPRLKPKVEKALLRSEPIKVKHDTPRSLTPDGKTTYGAEEVGGYRSGGAVAPEIGTQGFLVAVEPHRQGHS